MKDLVFGQCLPAPPAKTWVVTCRLCPHRVRAITEAAASDAFTDHLAAVHSETPCAPQ